MSAPCQMWYLLVRKWSHSSHLLPEASLSASLQEDAREATRGLDEALQQSARLHIPKLELVVLVWLGIMRPNGLTLVSLWASERLDIVRLETHYFVVSPIPQMRLLRVTCVACAGSAGIVAGGFLIVEHVQRKQLVAVERHLRGWA